MRGFFQSNLDILFFIYGFAFVITGLAIVVQPRRNSSFKIANMLNFLGGFALIHGLNEWLDMWAIIRGAKYPILWLDIARFLALLFSYICLFEFGRRITQLIIKNKEKAYFLKPRIGFVITAVVLALGFLGKNYLYMASVWTRYLLGLPAGILTAVGLFFYYRKEIKLVFPGLRWNFYYSAFAFLIYGFAAGLVVPPVGFFPGSIINTQVFFELTGGIPVQAIRAICAVVIGIYICRILAIFRWETVKNLCSVETERFADKITSSVEEMIMVIDKDMRIKWANKPVKLAFGADICGELCHKVTHRSDTRCHPPNDLCPIEEALNTKKPATVIHKHFDKMGNTIYAEVAAYPMLDDFGGLSGDFIHTSRNVTDRIKSQRELEEAYTELKAIQERLLAAEKMASLGKLSAGIAHEINNPIGYVISNLSTLDKYLSSLAPLLERYTKVEDGFDALSKEDLANISRELKEIKERIDYTYLVSDLPKLVKETADGAQRVVRIIRDLKSFSRQDEIEFKEANLIELVESSLNIVWNEVKYKADIVKEYGDVPLIYCHPQQISQVFMNIFVNAAQSIEERGKITIKACFKDNKAHVEISDTGKGMTAEVKEKIFEPFFTTKKVGEGTGLGLAIVYGIIQKHKGSIDVKSVPGQGSTFAIALPRNEPKAAKQ